MNEIKLQPNDVFGKSISDIEKQIIKTKGKSVIAARLFPQGIVLLFVIMLAIILALKCEVSGLQATITQLNSENASLNSKLNAQAKLVLPAIKTSEDKGTEGFISHVVQAGDCFDAISERYYQTGDYVSELARLNGLTINSTLQIGQIIRVPKNKADLKKEP